MPARTAAAPAVATLRVRAAGIGQRLVPGASDAVTIANRARRNGQLLTAWDGERDLYPAFQWDAEGRLRARLSELLAVFRRDRDGSLGTDPVVYMWQANDVLG